MNVNSTGRSLETATVSCVTFRSSLASFVQAEKLLAVGFVALEYFPEATGPLLPVYTGTLVHVVCDISA